MITRKRRRSRIHSIASYRLQAHFEPLFQNIKTINGFRDRFGDIAKSSELWMAIAKLYEAQTNEQKIMKSLDKIVREIARGNK
jgi:hypothetical protein